MVSGKKVVIVSGYFNPIHKGHIEYLQLAKRLGDYLIVIINNDYQRELKGSKKFQDEMERVFIVENIKGVDEVFLSVDMDRTVRKTLMMIDRIYGIQNKLIFANGGDQSNTIIPERDTCERIGIQLVDGLGDKIQSSSWLLNN
jgi:cytidyltransferase-like protein